MLLTLVFGLCVLFALLLGLTLGLLLGLLLGLRMLLGISFFRDSEVLSYLDMVSVDIVGRAQVFG